MALTKKEKHEMRLNIGYILDTYCQVCDDQKCSICPWHQQLTNNGNKLMDSNEHILMSAKERYDQYVAIKKENHFMLEKLIAKEMNIPLTSLSRLKRKWLSLGFEKIW